MGLTTFADLGVVPGECRVVAEIGAANGDLQWALDAVQQAAATGAVWGVKGQLYDRTRLVTRTAPTYGHDMVREPDTQWEHFNRVLDYNQWWQVRNRTLMRNMHWFASVFDTEAVDWCESVGIHLYKIASADITHQPLLEYVAATGKPIVLSTGGATLGEIERATTWIRDASPDPDTCEVLPLICTLSYPTSPQDANLARLKWWRENISDMVGYSDHTEGISAMLTARELGAVMIEKHFTITPGMGGDHDFALTPQQLEAYSVCPPGIGGPNQRLEMGTSGLGPTVTEHAAVANARRSIAAKVDIQQGNIINRDDITFLRPGTGAYKPYEVDQVVGQAAPCDIPAGTLVPVLRKTPGTTARSTITANLTVE